MNEVDFETLIEHEELDVLFACETPKMRWRSGIVSPLKFECSLISLEVHKRRQRGSDGIGIAFLTKHKDLLRRESAYEKKHLKMLQVRYANLKIVGLYAFSSASAQKWFATNAALKCLHAKFGMKALESGIYDNPILS